MNVVWRLISLRALKKSNYENIKQMRHATSKQCNRGLLFKELTDDDMTWEMWGPM